MISRAVSVPNLSRDRKLCVILAQAILRDQHIVRSLDEGINKLRDELEAMEGQKKQLQERISILKSSIRVFNKPCAASGGEPDPLPGSPVED